ncbi:hypothetical protein N7468_005417 [Penicillium chermesinum]|uniref:Uncharacterized protein n=1 Tax=Penicillium chermesinum TaxID=63820 RepID=A0A9W9TMZ2_9EURO|nr:uncharacterized protein N7468_005417 [Penicillium chermesinum]KAJ5232461.1 hypothetical protein N7468_005417 [Penicillium chermesinum]
MEFHNSSSSFSKRRSYPNLNHVSLAPLTPRFPIDDDDLESEDYFGQTLHDDQNSATRTSYLSSLSVPSTPPILSHSRSTSRTRHHARSKSSTRAAPSSDTNLQSHNVSFPLHHTQTAFPQKKYLHSRHGHLPAATKSDTEWMLRAGIALASSTREEKGQSWLSKRESSTSLVSTPPNDPTASIHDRHHQRAKSGASARKSRSGASTPAALSRRTSRSRGQSRRGSRVGLTMTTIPPLSSTTAGKASSPGTGASSPAESRGRPHGLIPDFVDERIRAEMAALQRERALSDEGSADYGVEDEESDSDVYSDDTPDDFDEADLQRLTRERGFGLGTWLDRLVEWTLFGVDELPVAVSTPAADTRIGAAATTTTVTFEQPGLVGAQKNETSSLASEDGRSMHDEADALSQTDGESVVAIEKPGSLGGWEDASWLFQVVKRALI